MSTFTTNRNFEQPANNSYVGDWDVPVNANWSAIDQSFGRVQAVAMSSTNVALTVNQMRCCGFELTGTLSANVQLQFPAGVGGNYTVVNNTTGNFTVTVVSGVGAQAIIPNGYVPIFTDGVSVLITANGSEPPGKGAFFFLAAAPTGWLLCNGASYPTANFPGLFNAIGYTFGGAGANFNVPNMTGAVPAGIDTGGTILSGAATVGAIIGSQNVVLVTGNLPAHTHPVNITSSGQSADHTHGAPGTSGSWVTQVSAGQNSAIGTGGVAVNTGTNTQTLGTSNDHTHNVVGNTGNQGSGTAHNNVQPTFVGLWCIKY